MEQINIYSSKEFQYFFKSSNRSLVLNANPPHFTVVAVSDDYLKITHKEHSDVLGNNLFEVYPGSQADPSEKNSVYSSFMRAINTKETDVLPTFKYEIYVTGKGGMETQYWSNLNEPLLDDEGNVAYIINTTANITEQIETRETLQRMNAELTAMNEELSAANEDLLRAQNDYLKVYNQLLKNQEDLLFTIEAASIATFDINPATSTVTGNDLLKTWFGFPPDEEVEWQKVTGVIAEEDRQRVINAIHEAMCFESGGNYNIEYAINVPNHLTPMMVKTKGKTKFDENNQPIRMSGILQDVTEQKRDEQRKSDFIGMVSHEMKTPLTSLSGFLQFLQIKTPKEDVVSNNLLDKANKQISRITTLINGFLNVSRLESGKIQIDKQRFDMADLVKELKEEILSMYSSHRIVFAPVEETFVIADWDKIGQVITNLISNAVKYSPPNTTVNVACVTVDRFVTISVKDDGIGVKPEDQNKLFERYYRVNNDGSKSATGFGIGLYLCAEVIQRHEGKIWVQSDVGKGSTFSFSLPVVE